MFIIIKIFKLFLNIFFLYQILFKKLFTYIHYIFVFIFCIEFLIQMNQTNNNFYLFFIQPGHTIHLHAVQIKIISIINIFKINIKKKITI